MTPLVRPLSGALQLPGSVFCSPPALGLLLKEGESYKMQLLNTDFGRYVFIKMLVYGTFLGVI